VGVFHAAAIIFDKDGVLLDTMALIRAAWADWAVKRGLDVDEVLASIHMTAFELIARYAPSADPVTEIRAIAESQAARESSIAPFDGARELVHRLPPDAWAIVTSARRDVALRHLDISGLPVPRVLISAEDTPRGKPDPAGYRLAAERLGARPERCIVVEDAPAGVRAAQAAGMFVIAVTTTHSDADLGEADAVIASVTELDVGANPLEDGSRVSVRWEDRVPDLDDPT
jgi:sugar-phosphatase